MRSRIRCYGPTSHRKGGREVQGCKVLMAKVGSMSSGTCTCKARADNVCGTKMHDQVGCKGERVCCLLILNLVSSTLGGSGFLPPFDLTDRSETRQQATVLCLSHCCRLLHIVASRILRSFELDSQKYFIHCVQSNSIQSSPPESFLILIF